MTNPANLSINTDASPPGVGPVMRDFSLLNSRVNLTGGNRAILQRKKPDGYHDYLVDCEPVVNPFDVETLVPGWYRLRDPA